MSTPEPLEAVPIIERHRPSLVLLDIKMPGIDGLTLLEQIREIDPVPVIMLTAIDSSEHAVRAMQLGADDYLTKRIGAKALIRKIRQMLGTPRSLPVHKRIAHYELVREIGHGGMGAVYEALDTTLSRPVALKVLLPELAADPFYQLLFLREARAAANLSHPGIVTIFQAGRFRGQLFMAMEFVRGTSLFERMHTADPIETPQAIRIILEAAQAIHAAHNAGFVHQDIKPSNIMITTAGAVKILDFGLARPARALLEAAKAATFEGTPLYASPEQIDGSPVDGRSDIFSLGIVLHELLAGGHPFIISDEATSVVAERISERDVVRPLPQGLEPGLKTLTERMLAADPRERPSSMEEVTRILLTGSS
jgi:serine/threonine-protein kinase